MIRIKKIKFQILIINNGCTFVLVHIHMLIIVILIAEV